MKINIIKNLPFADNYIFLCEISYYINKKVRSNEGKSKIGKVLIYKEETIFCNKRLLEYGHNKPKGLTESNYKKVRSIDIKLLKKVGSNAN
jgi:hypothetical protein